jgi:D-3-phosphoglycerate dehydrogenase
VKSPAKIRFLRRFFAEDLGYLREHLSRRVELIEPRDRAPQGLAAAAAHADVLLGGAVTEPVLAAAKRLKLLQVPWTGVDTLDFALLRRFKVAVCNSHSNARPAAEFALSLLLSALNAIPLHDRRLREGHWLRPRRDGQGEFYPPRPLSGRTVGYLADAVENINRLAAGRPLINRVDLGAGY